MEFVVFMALPWPFMWLALREYQPQYQNMRMVHMIITAVIFFVAAIVLVATQDEGVIIENNQQQRSSAVDRFQVCLVQPWDDQVGCGTAQSVYREQRVIIWHRIIEPCGDAPCVNEMLMISVFYSGLGVLFTVLAISEALIISDAAARKGGV